MRDRSKHTATATQWLANGDVGGTNSRMQLWEVDDEQPALRFDRRYQSRDFRSLESLVSTFLADSAAALEAAPSSPPRLGELAVVDALCVAICGPVADETHTTGPVLPDQGPTGWDANIATVLQGLGGAVRRARLINDFVAVGYGVPAVSADAIEWLHQTPPTPTRASTSARSRGVMAAVGAGTGLGGVYCTWHAGLSQYEAHPSEGGMGEFRALTDRQWRLRQFLLKEDGHATVESVVSGPGLHRCFAFVVREALSADKGAADLLAEVASAADVTAAALSSDAAHHRRCREALDLWLECLAAHLRQTALTLLPTGGLYLCGGIPPRIVSVLRESLAPGLFVADDVMGDFIRTHVPLALVTDDDVGLLGARIRAEQLLQV